MAVKEGVDRVDSTVVCAFCDPILDLLIGKSAYFQDSVDRADQKVFVNGAIRMSRRSLPLQASFEQQDLVRPWLDASNHRHLSSVDPDNTGGVGPRRFLGCLCCPGLRRMGWSMQSTKVANDQTNDEADSTGARR